MYLNDLRQIHPCHLWTPLIQRFSGFLFLYIQTSSASYIVLTIFAMTHSEYLEVNTIQHLLETHF